MLACPGCEKERARRTIFGMYRLSRREWIVAAAASVWGVTAAGCQWKDAPPPANKPGDDRPLRVLVVDSPPLAERIERYWRSQSEAPFELRSATSAEVADLPRLRADVVVYPSQMLGSLVTTDRIAAIRPKLLESEAFDRHDLLQHARLAEVQWGSQPFAVSLGAPPLVLYARHDLLEKSGIEPTTWSDYQKLVEAAAESVPEDGVPVLEPLSAGWAGKTLLAHAASYVRHRDEYGGLFDMRSMEPRIATPPFVRALDELLSVAQVAGGEKQDLLLEATPATAREAIYNGRCALAWSWPTAAAKVQAASTPLRILPLPGSNEYYNAALGQWQTRDGIVHVPVLGMAGHLASVTVEARRPTAAENFLGWLSNGDATLEIIPASPTSAPFRESQTRRPAAWCEAQLAPEGMNDYMEVVRRSHETSLTLLAPRIPGAGEYLAALDEAVRQAATGKATPQDALDQGAAAWEAITERRGRETQRQAYQRSLGLDA